jgi:hypothetical protein
VQQAVAAPALWRLRQRLVARRARHRDAQRGGDSRVRLMMPPQQSAEDVEEQQEQEQEQEQEEEGEEEPSPARSGSRRQSVAAPAPARGAGGGSGRW